MKKTLSALSFLGVILLTSTYFVGEMTARETEKLFLKQQPQELNSRLISYEKNFLTADALSEVTVTLEGENPVIFSIHSRIKHYPYKAVISNDIRLSDSELGAKLDNYFGSEKWLNSQEEISIFGNLSGRLNLSAGSYENAREKISSRPLQLDYQVDLQDYSGSAQINWAGADAATSSGDFSIESVQLFSDFSSLSTNGSYAYFSKIGKVIIGQKNYQSILQGLELKGSSQAGQKADTVDTSNEWKIARYEMNDGQGKVFTDNQIKLEIKGLYSPALDILANSSENKQLVENALKDLLAKGAELNLSKLSSQTPWGEVDGYLQLTLQQGAPLVEVIGNPFMLFDYVNGKAKLALPDSLLEEPAVAESLQMGLRTGFLKHENNSLSLETYLERGEFSVNGRVIPL
ncbi:DUF945 family protein [Psychromonas aquimarina]|uniref:DUF945 family protein n=1 Tax=Psychromonas aquimarina TaxID=444919 RepID=UPI00042710C0|nr:DUF945 family protein [Psychromonas aquimarina]